MSASAIDAAVAAANPVPLGALASAPMTDARAQLLAAIFAESPGGPAPAHALPRSVKRSGRRGPLLALGAAVAIAAALVSFVLAGSGAPTVQSPAFGAELVRYADSSPLVLLQLHGWHVSYANEEASGEGEMHFLPDGASESAALRMAQLDWRIGTLSSWEAERAVNPDLTRSTRVLGTAAHVYRYKSGSPGSYIFAAFWLYHGRVLEFRATTDGFQRFERMLSALHRVDNTTWLSALPSSVIDAAGHRATVEAMLKGIPLPPGFDASRIIENGLAQERYQLGAAVAGTAACMWIGRWLQARRSGDSSEAQTAIAAMASSPQWPVLRSMESRGAYPQVLEEYAAHMTSGGRSGHPLGAADADSGLGCASLGVPIALTKAEREAARVTGGPQLVTGAR